VETVLALGFDLFFKPKLNDAAKAVGVALRYATPAEAVKAAEGAARVVADVSAPGVEETLRAIRAARPDVPILACYPHVEAHRARAVEALGGVAVTRGAFSGDLAGALAGRVA
jgi:CheY-like chemotaxis protein